MLTLLFYIFHEREQQLHAKKEKSRAHLWLGRTCDRFTITLCFIVFASWRIGGSAILTPSSLSSSNTFYYSSSHRHTGTYTAVLHLYIVYTDCTVQCTLYEYKPQYIPSFTNLKILSAAITTVHSGQEFILQMDRMICNSPLFFKSFF